jgi:hypothetical protein
MPRLFVPVVVLAATLAGMVAAGSAALAQVGPGGVLNPQRDCQTIRTCNYREGGSFRGCISTYACRVCRFVPASCKGLGRRGTCQKLRCTWGGIS